jgi:hypothetical protein
MPKTLSQKKLGIEAALVDLKQRDVEAFFAALREIAPAYRQMGTLERAGYYVRAAARAGWLTGVVEAEVDGMAPAAALWLGVRVDKHLGEAITIDPK